MDQDEIRRMVIGKLTESVGAPEESSEETAQAVVYEDNIYAFRDKLKKVHAYEKICKEDSEQWDEDTWAQFKVWLGESKSPFKAPKKGLLDLLEDVNKNKVGVSDEQSEFRKKVLESVNLNYVRG